MLVLAPFIFCFLFVPNRKFCAIKISTNYKCKLTQLRVMTEPTLLESEGNKKSLRIHMPVYADKKFMKQIEIILHGPTTGVKDTS